MAPPSPVSRKPRGARRGGPRLALLLLAVLGSLAAGCACELVTVPRAAYTYRVGPGDLLTIDVYAQEGLSREVTVSPDGKIAFPFAGSAMVAGRTPQEVAVLVSERLGPSFRDPVVTVALKESRSAQVHVLGEVEKQGPVPFRDPLYLAEAISLAGGPRWATSKLESVRLIRGKLDKPLVVEIDFECLLEGEQADVLLDTGDIVLVPAKNVTTFDRYIRQLLSPVSAVSGPTFQAVEASQ